MIFSRRGRLEFGMEFGIWNLELFSGRYATQNMNKPFSVG